MINLMKTEIARELPHSNQCTYVPFPSSLLFDEIQSGSCIWSNYKEDSHVFCDLYTVVINLLFHFMLTRYRVIRHNLVSLKNILHSECVSFKVIDKVCILFQSFVYLTIILSYL